MRRCATGENTGTYVQSVPQSKVLTIHLHRSFRNAVSFCCFDRLKPPAVSINLNCMVCWCFCVEGKVVWHALAFLQFSFCRPRCRCATGRRVPLGTSLASNRFRCCLRSAASHCSASASVLHSSLILHSRFVAGTSLHANGRLIAPRLSHASNSDSSRASAVRDEQDERVSPSAHTTRISSRRTFC